MSLTARLCLCLLLVSCRPFPAIKGTGRAQVVVALDGDFKTRAVAADVAFCRVRLRTWNGTALGAIEGTYDSTARSVVFDGVEPGTYNACLTLNKSLTLRGTNPPNPKAPQAPNREGFAYSYDYGRREGSRGLPILPVLGVRGEL